MNPYGAKAATYMIEHCPHHYDAIEDKEAYFTEIGEEAQRQVSSTYSKISRPELGRDGPGTRRWPRRLIHESDLSEPVREERRADGPGTRRLATYESSKTSGREPLPTRRTSTTSPPPER